MDDEIRLRVEVLRALGTNRLQNLSGFSGIGSLTFIEPGLRMILIKMDNEIREALFHPTKLLEDIEQEILGCYGSKD